MDPTTPSTSPEDIQAQYRRVRALQTAVYAQDDPTADADLYRQLLQEEAKLSELERRAPPPKTSAAEKAPGVSRGRFLGPKTTGLRVEASLRMQPLPTGVYHLLNPETDPLVTVLVANESRDPRRVCVKVYLEGLSAQDVRTVEIDPRSERTLKLLPTLFPRQARQVTEIRRATLHVVAEDLDGRPESHDTFSLVCLSRNSSFNSVVRPETGQRVDLSHYYGAWVTPNVEAVQERVRHAATLLPERRIWGYQGAADGIDRQVEALYRSLKAAGVAYVNSVIDYGAPAGQATQRTRLPRQALQRKSANCIDGTVLMASLLEAASLNAALAFKPGHACVGWETWDGSGEWKFLETTLIDRADFGAACASGQRQYVEMKDFYPDQLKVHALPKLRADGIWPME
jgi:hypothetical protein